VFWRVIRLEIVNVLRDVRLAAALGTCVAVFFLSGTAALMHVRDDARVKAEVSAAERDRWLGQGEKDPHSAAHYSIYAFRPVSPLEAIEPGIAPFVGQAVWLEAHLQNDLLSRPQQDATMFQRLGVVDPAALLIRVGPLVVFLLAFALAAGDRGLGTQALAFGNAPSRGVFVAAKIVGTSALGMLALVVPLTLVGAVSVALYGSHPMDAGIRLIGWLAGATAYVAITSIVAVIVCMAAASVQTALSVLLLAWVGLVLAALPAGSALAEWTRQLPSFQQTKLVLVDEAPAYWTPEAGAEQTATILRRYGVQSERELDERQINVRGAQLDVAERHAQEVFDREIGGFYDHVVAQDLAYAHLGWLSPAVAFDAVSSAIAGTDFLHHRHFVDAAESYRRGLVNRMNADLIPHPAVGGREHTNDISLWSDVPPFEYRPRPVMAAVQSALSPLLALATWLVAAIVASAAIARRVRP
jgi:ABC-2 type transport system permease protein